MEYFRRAAMSICTPLSLSIVAVATTVTIGLLYVIRGRRYVTTGSDVTTGSGNGDARKVPESVNYHLTRQCNYKCGFCFHTAKTSYRLDLEDAKRGLKMLKDAGDFALYLSVFPTIFLHTLYA